MHIHRFERVWLALALVFIIGLISTVVYGSVGPGIDMIDDEGGQVAPGDFDGTEFEDPGVRQVGDGEYEVYVVAQQFSFNPGTPAEGVIRVPADSTVTFYITSKDVVHGFEVAGTNLNTMAIPGQVSKVTVEFDEAATYGIVCNEYCGPAHHAMEGRLVVVPESEYEGPSGSNESTATDEPNETDSNALSGSTTDALAGISTGHVGAWASTSVDSPSGGPVATSTEVAA